MTNETHSPETSPEQQSPEDGLDTDSSSAEVDVAKQPDTEDAANKVDDSNPISHELDPDDDDEEDTEQAEKAEQAAAELSEEERLVRIEMLKPVIEGAVMAAGETVKISRLQNLFDEGDMPSKGMIVDVLEAVQKDCEGRGFELIEVASGWRFQVRDDYATWVNRLWEEKPQKYSRALLETLALVAYRQPLTRGDIEEVRGVAVSSHIIKTLTEREWVKVVGHRDVPGRPALYATTKTFLDYFNLKSLDELPTLGELRDIESLNASLDLNDQAPPELIAEMKAEAAVPEQVNGEIAEPEAEPAEVDSGDNNSNIENQDMDDQTNSVDDEQIVSSELDENDGTESSIDKGEGNHHV